MFRKDVNRACENCDESQSNFFDAEAGCEALTDELKVKLISVLYDNQEETCLEIEDIEEELNKKLNLTCEMNGMTLKR